MSISVNSSGSWKNVSQVSVRVAGVWKQITEAYVRSGGVWKKFYDTVPDGLIAFSLSTTVTGWAKLNGSEASPSLIGRYPRVSYSQGGTGGSVTHTHASQNFNTQTASYGYTSYGTTVQSANWNHTHTMNHGHTAATNHEPPYINILPVRASLGSPVLSTMFLFYDGATAPSGWSVETSAIDKFYKGSETPTGGGGAASHSHSATLDTSFDTPGAVMVGQAPTGASGRRDFAIAHIHTANHTHSNGNNYPLWASLLPIKPNAQTTTLPSGICAFFTGSIVPVGWSCYSSLAGRWIQGKTTVTSGGSDTHGHALTNVYSGPFAMAQDWIRSGEVVLPYTGSHMHFMNHTHSAVNNQIPYQDLLFCKKD